MADYLDLLKALNLENVNFVVVGGFAMMLHSASTVTFDLDIAIALDQGNGEALIRALAPFRPYPPQFGSADNFVWDDRSLIGAVMALKSAAGHIDILRVLPEVDSFEGLFDRSIVKILKGQEIRVASIDDLIAMKAAAGRPKDLDHIRHLEAIKKLKPDA